MKMVNLKKSSYSFTDSKQITQFCDFVNVFHNNYFKIYILYLTQKVNYLKFAKTARGNVK